MALLNRHSITSRLVESKRVFFPSQLQLNLNLRRIVLCTDIARISGLPESAFFRHVMALLPKTLIISKCLYGSPLILKGKSKFNYDVSRFSSIFYFFLRWLATMKYVTRHIVRKWKWIKLMRKSVKTDRVSFFGQCTRLQFFTLLNFNIQTCFSQFL